MKTDLDALMRERGVDALLVTGPADHNPPMVYLTGGGHLTSADLVKKRGEPPVLFYNTMERDEAARTGLQTRSYADYSLIELLKTTRNDMLKAQVLRYQMMLADLGITRGRLLVSGKKDAGAAYALYAGLSKAMPDLEIVGELDDSLLMQAQATKDEQEVEHIRRMGKITTTVVDRVADYLTSQSVRDGVLLGSDGQPVTIGAVKSRINLWLAELGAENPEGTIFAIGRDAGVPHSSGTASDLLRLGQTIVFDIFPCEMGGGYFYDFTRTWCLGYAPDEVQALYQDVLEVYNQITSELRPGVACPEYQTRTCDLFEARGHPTIKNDPLVTEGYVHALGHGVGLNIHERPWFGRSATQADRLLPGSVVTIEPGLYYPEKGMGVRLEDTLWVRPDGEIEVLVEYPKELVLPVKL